MNAARHLERILRATIRHPRRVVALYLLATIVALGAAVARLELRTSNLDLIDAGLPEVSDFRRFALEFGTPNLLVVVLEGERPAELHRAVDRIAPELRKVPGVAGVIDRLPFDRPALPLAAPSPYFESRDGGLAFVFVRPDDPLSRASTIEPFVRGVRQVLDGAGLADSGVHAGLTGMPKYALDDRDGVRHDLSRLSLLSLGLVLALFVFSFRSWRRPLLAAICLLVSVALTLGAVSVYPGHLTLLSAFFATVLFGLGIDYGIHLVSRVEQDAAGGRAEAEATASATRSTSRAITTGALTTCAVFLAMAFSGFRGFAELGVVAGTGVLICLVVTLTLMPALLILFPGRRREPTPGPVEARRRSRLAALARPEAAIALLLLAVGGALLGVPRFDRDYLSLQRRDSEAVRLEREMVRRSDLSPTFAAFTVGSREEAAALTARLADEPTVGRVYSIAALDLLELLGGKGAPESMREGLVSRSGRFAVYAWPAEDVWTDGDGSFVERMRAIDPHVTGMPILGDFMVERSRRALRISAALGGLALLACLLADFRRPLPALLAALPALATVPLLFVGMRLLGISFNPLNVMALPVILGIAVDDGVHLVHRFLEEGGRIEEALAGTGRAIVLTTATTLAAFGTLGLAAHRGLASFGVVVAVGVFSALVLTLVVLPVTLRWLRGRLRIAGALLLAILAGGTVASPARAACDPLAWEWSGDLAWAERDRGFAENGVPDAGPVRDALRAWQWASERDPDSLRLRFKRIEALYFESEFVDPTPAHRREAHERMVELADDGPERPFDERVQALRSVPGAAEAHFWSAISWGLWGLSHGMMASATRNVAVRIRDHAALLEAIDERYADGAGARILGRLHTATPRVPMFTGWIRREFGIEELQRALVVSDADPRNALFLADALWRLRPERSDEARRLLREMETR